MNEKAETLGLEQTRFANPHGLDDENNYSTAYDMAHLAAYAMENPLFREVVSTKNAAISGRSLTNHNKLLWRCEGAVGIKTGYTRQAGRILVSAVEREGRRLVAVTMNAPSDWNDHMALMDYGFSAFETSTWIEQGEKLAIVRLFPAKLQQRPYRRQSRFPMRCFRRRSRNFVFCCQGWPMRRCSREHRPAWPRSCCTVR